MFLSLYINIVSTHSKEALCYFLTALQTVDVKAHTCETCGVHPQLRLWTLTGAFPHTLLHVKLCLGEIPKFHPMHPSVYESVLKMHGVKRCFNAASTSHSAGVSKYPRHMTTAN